MEKTKAQLKLVKRYKLLSQRYGMFRVVLPRTYYAMDGRKVTVGINITWERNLNYA
jgi:hypothetical protein